ncbi:MAG TPA: hypothetical protein VEZ70_14405 [Allosphingosinicella sp.]|nr:hypothetical protein [Allosphingosinicella sp.]
MPILRIFTATGTGFNGAVRRALGAPAQTMEIGNASAASGVLYQGGASALVTLQADVDCHVVFSGAGPGAPAPEASPNGMLLPAKVLVDFEVGSHQKLAVIGAGS